MKNSTIWSSFTKPSCYPECNCEALRDALIVQPSATLSSLPLIFLGIWMISRSKSLDKRLLMQAICVMFLGIASTLAHASFTAWALHLDFFAILMYFSWNAIYYSKIKFSLNWIFLWLVLTFLVFGLTYLFEPYRIILCISYFALIFLLWLQWLKKNTWVLKYFICAYFVMGLSALLFYLDEMKIWCPKDLSGWVFGHSLWHLGVCFAIGITFYPLTAIKDKIPE